MSPRTVFRYFPTKADLVVYDALDEIVLPAVRAQPQSVGAIDAMRLALVQVFSHLTGDAREAQMRRERLLRTVPELRGAMMEELARTVDEIAAIVAERSGRPADDPELVALAGAGLGVVLVAWLRSGDVWSDDFVRRVDDGLARLKRGFAL